jgi:pimeloyl-ACP methyl ester carboxylesterase
VLSVIGWGLGIYATLLVVAWLGQASLLYPAPRRPITPELEGATLERIPGPDGRTVYALHVPAPGDAPTLVHFHGNGEELADQVPLLRLLRAHGLGVFAVEYPGYGLARDELRQSADAEAAISRLRELGVPRERTVLLGLSLGSGVAAEMALRGHGARLILLAPFTSVSDMAARMLPVLPARWLVRDRFDTAAKAARIAVPSLVVHGDHDEVIPLEMGRRVSELLPRSRLVIIAGGGHTDLFAEHADRVVSEIVWFSRGLDR